MTAAKRKAAKPKLGRPALPEGDVKEVFAIRISRADREALQAAADRAGKSLTQWARDALISVASSR